MRTGAQAVLHRALSLQGFGPAQAETARAVVFAILLAELLVAAMGRRRPVRTSGRPRSAAAPVRLHRPARGSLPGRRPRG